MAHRRTNIETIRKSYESIFQIKKNVNHSHLYIMRKQGQLANDATSSVYDYYLRFLSVA